MILNNLTLFSLLLSTSWTHANEIFNAPPHKIVHNASEKTVTITAEKRNLSLVIDYSRGCVITEMNIDGKNVVGKSGVFTGVQIKKNPTDSRISREKVRVQQQADEITLSGIGYGTIRESWQFVPEDEKINWTINRTYNEDLILEDMAMPIWNFAAEANWKGGILDNGGMVWFKYLRPFDTYGVHTGGVTFWNEENGTALKVSPITQSGRSVASKFSQNEKAEFNCTHLISDEELGQRYELSRFVAKKQDVFAPFEVKKGTVSIKYVLENIDYHSRYNRGILPGIDAEAIRELLNTTARYGVVDNRIVGANGWITNWKCLHEPFFAQIGLALNDQNYTDNLSATLDQERDLAIRTDGRVLSRWHDVAGDEISGTYNKETGYYEAIWGYTVDSQTGYVINTAEQFQQTGDVKWLDRHKASIERALDWLIRRDSNGNGIFEMVNRNIAEQKASDWIDIVWAGFENAFVNAQMYEALKLWSECENVLGDMEKSRYYMKVAEQLKRAYNKTVDEGGFWSPQKKQYVYWRDNDNTIHGDNLVTPVNFAAIAFGICDDPARIHLILDNIESRTSAEHLFHWPLCFESFKKEEVHANNWPFPNYENGDIFPTWGYLGIRSYIKYDKRLAVKYIRNILSQYRKDGLSSQRYSRVDQKGLGTDILAGISTTVTALYSDIYGIKPKWNRIGLEPNMIPELNGTTFSYTLRDTIYEIMLSVDNYQLRTPGFTVRSAGAFGVGSADGNLFYYPDNNDTTKLTVHSQSSVPIDLEVTQWEGKKHQWTINNKGKKKLTIDGLSPKAKYEIEMNGNRSKVSVLPNGSLSFGSDESGPISFKLRKLD